jgi:hypothetical protein
MIMKIQKNSIVEIEKQNTLMVIVTTELVNIFQMTLKYPESSLPNPRTQARDFCEVHHKVLHRIR